MIKAKQICKILLSAALMLFIIISIPISQATLAQKSPKTVRVGWYDSSFNSKDDENRRTGYAYEYQQEIASYTNWEYEYVEGSWTDLLQMLIDGKIDLLSDVSYTKQRSENMLFSEISMGEEDYYLYTTSGKGNVDVHDYSSFKGKIVGINKDSVQVSIFKQWAKDNNLKMKVVELTDSTKESVAMLTSGKIDFYVSPENLSKNNYVLPITKIGSSNIYFSVNKNRPDLLSELNLAMNKITDDNPYYNSQLHSKYLYFSQMHRYFSSEELKWIKEHKKIRVGYQDNYLAFCAKDKKTGKLIGALKDYLKEASKCMENAKIKFETVAFPTSKEALEALKKGKIDCMFPANLTDYYGEIKGYYITNPLMTTEMSAIVKEDDKDSLLKRKKVAVAVNTGNTNYDMFLVNHFPDWRPIYFKDSQECLKAISQGKAECLIISNYRYNNLIDTCKKLNLTSIPLGVEMDYCYAVNNGDTVLYSILNRINSVVDPLTTKKALDNYYKADDFQVTFGYFLSQNIISVIITACIIVAVLLIYILSILRIRKKAKEKEELIVATQKDELTGLYIRNYFYEYANKLFEDNPEMPMDTVVININNFHSVNSINSYEFGDIVLKELGEEISMFLDSQGGIASRTEADHFAIYCSQINNYHDLYNRLQERLDSIVSKTSVQIRMGVMPWHRGMEPKSLVDCAVIACNMARTIYKSPMLVYDEEMREKELFDQTLLNDLRKGLDNNEFIVCYQPKYDIQRTPYKVIGAEALVRWQHPTLGKLTPNLFIELFEKNSKIGLLDKYVLEKVAEQIVAWKEKYGIIISVSINLSRIDVLSPLLEDTLDSTLEKYGLTPDAIRLEITESAYIENEKAFVEIVAKLRKKGYIIEMDDFGSAYSSLNLLTEMPIDTLKMDKILVKDIDTDKRRFRVAELVMRIAENLDVPVIAEGVENEKQLRILQNTGCAFAQGFYFAPALTAEEFEKKAIENQD